MSVHGEERLKSNVVQDGESRRSSWVANQCFSNSVWPATWSCWQDLYSFIVLKFFNKCCKNSSIRACKFILSEDKVVQILIALTAYHTPTLMSSNKTVFISLALSADHCLLFSVFLQLFKYSEQPRIFGGVSKCAVL